MDFQVVMDSSYPTGGLTFTKNSDIRTNIYLSLNIKKGSWFANTQFGNELYKVKKVTDAGLVLAKQYIEQALQWLIQTGKATSIKVEVVKSDKLGSINFNVQALQPNGITVYYQQFLDVQTGKLSWAPIGGPSATYVSP